MTPLCDGTEMDFNPATTNMPRRTALSRVATVLKT